MRSFVTRVKLRERPAEILIEASKRFDFVLAPVTRYAATKRRQWQMAP
jgi:hypothetical protein